MLRRARRNGELTDAERAATRALVASPKFELIPLKTAPDRIGELPGGSTVTVTASPAHTLEDTLDLCDEVAAAGHTPIPHLSAHMTRDRAHLDALLDRCREQAFTRAFVVGGDAKTPGEYHDGLALLRAMDEAGHPFIEIGVPSYPEGHASIPDARLLEVLKEKQRYAAYMATQMCFNPKAISTWIVRMRAEGIDLPINLGVPGVSDVTKLMTIATKIGIADSARYLKKNRSMVGHIMKGSFGPDALLEALAPELADPEANVVALHLFTFNHVGATVDWQRGMLEELGG